MTDSTVRIRATSLQKTFQRAGGEIVNALDNVNLEVKKGEFVVLLGPSGCGKTTLLRSIGGLETPESGEVLIDEKPVYSSKDRLNITPEKRNINMMFQSYALWPHMTVYQNVAYPLVSKKVKKSEIPAKVANILEKVGIPELSESHPADLSGGQQQRVALARALAFDPSCVLFDEPLSNVDAKVREQLRLELLDMHNKMQFSALYVTHDQVEAMQLADKLVVMRKGRIEQLGIPEEIYLRPANRYVANFIGVSNEAIGTVLSVDSGSYTVDTPFGKVVANSVATEYAKGHEVAAILRPESLKISETDPKEVNTWQATVHATMFAGAHTEYVVDLPGGRQAQIWDPNRRRSLKVGEKVFVSIHPDEVHLVPAEDSK